MTSINDVSANVLFNSRQVVVGKHLEKYNQITFPKINWQRLSSIGIKTVVVSEISHDNRVIATCICAPISNESIQLLSFYVEKSYRSLGIGTHLLKSVCHYIESSPFSSVHLDYKTFWSSNQAWEKILKKTGWEIQDKNLQYIKADNLLDWKTSKFIDYSINIPSSEFIEIDKTKLTALDNWLSLCQIDYVPSDVLPSKHLASNLCSSLSLLLLIDKQIAGWLICDQISDNTVQIGSLYVLPHFSQKHKHLAKGLVAEFIKRNDKDRQVFFGVRHDNIYMNRLLERFLGDKVTTYHKRKAIKILN